MSELAKRQGAGLIDMLVAEVSQAAKAAAQDVMTWFIDKPVAESVNITVATKKLSLYIHQLNPTREELVQCIRELSEECTFQPTPDEFRNRILLNREKAAFVARQDALARPTVMIDPRGVRHVVVASQVAAARADGWVDEAEQYKGRPAPDVKAIKAKLEGPVPMRMPEGRVLSREEARAMYDLGKNLAAQEGVASQS